MDLERRKEDICALANIINQSDRIRDAADNLGDAAAPGAISLAVSAIDAAVSTLATNQAADILDSMFAEPLVDKFDDGRPYDADTAISNALGAYDEDVIDTEGFLVAMDSWNCGDWPSFNAMVSA